MLERILLWTCPAALFHLGPPGKIYPMRNCEEFQKLLGKTVVIKTFFSEMLPL